MRNKEQPPTVKGGIFGGHFQEYRRDPPAFLQKITRLGDVTTFNLGSQTAFCINNPELIRDLLVTSSHKFVKGRGLQRARKLLGTGLLTSEDPFHLRQRRMIQPAFHRQRIAFYAEAMIELAEKTADDWHDGDERDVDAEMMRLTLNIVGKTLFGANVEDEADVIGKAMTISMFNLPSFPFTGLLEKLPLPHKKRFDDAKKTLDDVIYKIIDERRKSGVDTGDLLSMLLSAQDEESGAKMTDEQIRDECMTLFLAGHETTSNALTWTFYLLSQNPEAEAKFHAELEAVLKDKTLTPEDYPQLKYTQMVLAESMRILPPAWVIGRTAIEEHQFGGFTIPKGSLVLASIYAMHRDARFWADAEKFIPERWEKFSVKEAGQKFIYFPFSKGARSCIGEQFAWTEGVLLLAALGRSWKLNLMRGQKIAFRAMITLRPKYGMKMRIEKR
jgi:cytochrome P450